ncbi:MAG: hypothetical protein QF750_04970 [Prochlorococcaceae cyanobacterium ETNP14_MAG_5]|nr:hypothetical protein [Prochlorococcaceae cyanobacterium ETNP14_MAG_5]|tara:strand:- start:255 stop:440 length:186 start_codon:yes stop_codon:yes gene_type:complete
MLLVKPSVLKLGVRSIDAIEASLGSLILAGWGMVVLVLWPIYVCFSADWFAQLLEVFALGQ